MSDQLITVATFNFTTEPNFLLFKLALEHHGIPYYAADENTINANPFLSISVGGIRVQVHEDDLPEAVAIWREIKELDDTVARDIGNSDQILDDARNATEVDTIANNGTYRIIIGVLLMVIFLIILRVVLCGFSF